MSGVNITKSVGLGYIFLGMYYCLGITTIDKQAIASISVSAFLFVLSEFIHIQSDKVKKYRKLHFVMRGAPTFLGALAILAIIIIPFIRFEKFTENFYDILGTTLSFISFGLSICIIGKKIEKREQEYRDDVHQLLSEAKEIGVESKELLDEYNDLIKQMMGAAAADEKSPDKKD